MLTSIDLKRIDDQGLNIVAVNLNDSKLMTVD
jgi:hypothetical protein